MNILRSLALLTTVLLATPLHAQQSVVTYKLNPNGRLGDHLFIYARARWVAHTFNIPLVFVPFPQCELFALSTMQTTYPPKKFSKNKTMILSGPANTITLQPHAGITYVQQGMRWATDIPKNDAVFMATLRRELTPITPLTPTIQPPTNRVTVALHCRRGGGYDKPLLSEELLTKKQVALIYDRLQPARYRERGSIKPFMPNPPRKSYVDVVFPTKFLALSYYIEQLKRIAFLFDHRPLHVHLFTDDHNPKAIVEELHTALSEFDITYAYREHNTPQTNILDDLYGMQLFDCLVRSDSHFPAWAAILHDYAIDIAPEGGFDCTHWEAKNSGKKNNKKEDLYQLQVVVDKKVKRILPGRLEIVKQRVDAVQR